MENGELGTHLCGSIYDKKNQCEYLLYVDKEMMFKEKKRLNLYYVYCTAEGRCRSMGCAASFTGNSPVWCPKRKAKENNDVKEI